ncbi:hypothetical protein [Desulfotomaculum sp. 1211_IL3151]|uniref:hypothetical protein n=1 Tax=Desulfotomaculum sp. 1211_IL3151 TaxID=3084055 RepID=UPI002FDB212E
MFWLMVNVARAGALFAFKPSFVGFTKPVRLICSRSDFTPGSSLARYRANLTATSQVALEGYQYMKPL